MNAALLLSLVILIFTAAYKFYGSFLEKLVQIDAKEQTPAFTNYDGVDFVPANFWQVLFGHHFSSIAGAGPIIGPILVCLWWDTFRLLFGLWLVRFLSEVYMIFFL